ncbi:MAG: hypothetical protein Q9220_001727 [cf. Caloplaca sp. 1 TL-2023]
MRPLLPTATFAGLRAAQVDLDVAPTPAPRMGFDILKRLNGDPAVCGWVEGQARYNRTVLTTPDAGVTPFGQSALTSQSSGSESETTTPVAVTTMLPPPSPSPSPADMTLISGGAIAGAVAGSVLALAAIVGVVIFFVKRHRNKKDHERQEANVMSERARQSILFAQYAKPAPPSTLSPPTSPPLHARHPSDQTYVFPSSPPLSDQDRPWSPGSMHSRNGPAELAGENEGYPFQKR